MEFDSQSLEFLLKNYYSKNLYPHNLIAKWLTSYSEDPKYLANREFAFILRDDIHLRFLSFNSDKQFKDKLITSIPYKIDIGAVYNRPPSERKKMGEFYPLERELVFDIDLTDYDPIRNCCKETNVCKKCWRWITIAVKVLEHHLRNDFGFSHLLWVFSGRRGIHCWVADQKARSLNNRAREAVAKYLTFDKKSSIINKYRVHPMAEHAYRVIMDSGEFDQLVLEQGWLDSKEQWGAVLKLCADANMAKTIEKEFESEGVTPELRWSMLKLRFDEVARRKESGKLKIPKEPNELSRNFLRLFVLEYAYPKIDEKVSTGINHLLKAPFSVHPKTGNIAVPLNSANVGDLELDNLPRIDRLMKELSAATEDKNSQDKENVSEQAYRHTSLNKYVEIFEKFLRGIINI